MGQKARKSSFNLFLQQERLNRHWSQKEVAEKIGTTTNNVSRWELGQTVPGLYFRGKLCELFGKQPQELGLLVGQTVESQQPDDISIPQSLPSVNQRMPLWHIPYPRNPFFIGRDSILQSLDEALKRQNLVTALTQSYALNGLGGIGKTQIALEYAYRYAPAYTAIFWINAETLDTLLTSFVAITEVLNLPEQQDQDQHKIVRACIQWLERTSGWLLVFDNVEDAALLHPFLPASRQGSLLFTTRLQAVGIIAQQLLVERMQTEAGLALLLQRAKLLQPGTSLAQLAPADALAAQAIVAAMDGLPLALDQAGAYIEETQCGLEGYLHRYQQRRAQLLERRGRSSQDHPASVHTTVSIALHRVEQRSPAAAEILHVCAFLAPDAIPEELLTVAFSSRSEHLQTLAIDPWLLDEAIAVLGTYSLVHRDPTTKTLSLHRLVQAVVQDGLSQQEQKAWVRRLIAVLNQVFPTESQQMTRWPWCEQLVPHVTNVLNLLEQGADPLELSSLLYKIASYFHNRARHLEAVSYHQQALDLREQLLGPDDEGLVEVLIGLVEATWYVKTYTSTEVYAQRVIGILERTQGPHHFALVKPLNIWAHVYRVQGQFAQAEQLLMRALSIWIATILREDGLDDSPNQAPSQEGERQDAEMLIHQALFLWEQDPQRHHDPIGQTLSALSHVYQQQQRYEKAEQIIVPLQQLGKQALGEEHHILANSLMILIEVYKGQGRLVEAEQCCLQALTIREQALGFQHPLTRETHAVYDALSRAMDQEKGN